MPKVSLNKFYAGVHWSERKRLKDTYKLIVRRQFKHIFSKMNKYKVDYTFCFKSRPLDASNCMGAMGKMIEDIIFEDDSHKIITEITVKSRKAKDEKVIIEVEEN